MTAQLKTFHWSPREGMKMASKPSVVTVRYGDGYSQRRAAGLNAQLKTWSPVFRVQGEREIRALNDFLDAHAGYRAFLWRPPLVNRLVRVICPEWDVSNLGGYTDFSCRFEQVVI
ncbi:phage tail protein [Escherichia coli]|uniref:phage tail protein n=1 Tax=Escherichia coli TaxID=562 RepID=UPI0038B27462